MKTKEMKEMFNMKNIKTKNFKRLCLFSLLFFIGYSIYGQFAVYDSKSDANHAEEIAKITEQLRVAKDQADKLKVVQDEISKTTQYLEKVNNSIKNVQRLKTLAKNQAYTYQRVQELKTKYKNNSDLTFSLALTRLTNSIIEDTQNDIIEVTKIVNTGIFNMSDAERLDQIDKFQQKSSKKLEQLDVLETMFDNYVRAKKIYNQL